MPSAVLICCTRKYRAGQRGIVAVITHEQRRPRQLQINDVSRQFEADCRTVSDAHV